MNGDFDPLMTGLEITKAVTTFPEGHSNVCPSLMDSGSYLRYFSLDRCDGLLAQLKNIFFMEL